MENTDLYGGGSMPQQPLPNDTLILVFGILSIPICCCCNIFFIGGVPGLAFGIIALILANKSIALYTSNPNAYLLKSYKNVNAGRVLAIIGIVLGGMALISNIISIIMFGFSTDPQEAQQRMKDLLELYK